jgi:hypothetical protein
MCVSVWVFLWKTTTRGLVQFKKQVELFSSSIVCRAIKITFFLFLTLGWINSSTLSSTKWKENENFNPSTIFHCGWIYFFSLSLSLSLKLFLLVFVIISIYVAKKNWVSRKRSMILPSHDLTVSCVLHSKQKLPRLTHWESLDLHTNDDDKRVNTLFTWFPSRSRPLCFFFFCCSSFFCVLARVKTLYMRYRMREKPDLWAYFCPCSMLLTMSHSLFSHSYMKFSYNFFLLDD